MEKNSLFNLSSEQMKEKLLNFAKQPQPVQVEEEVIDEEGNTPVEQTSLSVEAFGCLYNIDPNLSLIHIIIKDMTQGQIKKFCPEANIRKISDDVFLVECEIEKSLELFKQLHDDDILIEEYASKVLETKFSRKERKKEMLFNSIFY